MADPEKGYPPAYSAGYPPPGGYTQQPGYPPQSQGYPPQGYPPQGYPPQGGYQQPPQNSSYNYDQGAGYASEPDNDYLIQSGHADFSNISVRQGFIRKVYGILFIQFAVTAIFTMIFCYSGSVKEWCQTPTAAAVMWANFAVLIVTEIVLICCEGVRRKHPLNLFVLGIFTLSMSFFVGIIASTYEPDAVFTAAGATALIVLALTIFSFQTKWDFTGMAPYLFVIIVCFMIFGFFAAIFRSNTLNLVYACIGVLIFSMFLVYDTQLLIGGKRYQLNEEEYVFAALNIYIDVIQIFLYLLEIFGRR